MGQIIAYGRKINCWSVNRIYAGLTFDVNLIGYPVPHQTFRLQYDRWHSRLQYFLAPTSTVENHASVKLGNDTHGSVFWLFKSLLIPNTARHITRNIPAEMAATIHHLSGLSALPVSVVFRCFTLKYRLLRNSHLLDVIFFIKTIFCVRLDAASSNNKMGI